MDHVVYVDSSAKEAEKLLSGEKTMIVRGAAGRKMPYGRVFDDDVLYFIRNNGEGKIIAKGVVKNVFNSPKMPPEESEKLLLNNSEKLQLSKKQFERWKGKRYLVTVEVTDVHPVEPFKIDRSEFGNMDDWLPVGTISNYTANN